MTNPNQIRGIITCRKTIALTEEKLLEALSRYGVSKVKRITKRIENAQINTPSVIITLTGTELPKQVELDRNIVYPKNLIPRPTVCFKCLEIGHIRTACRSSHKICYNCSEIMHTTSGDKCSNSKFCSRCQSGSHNLADKDCPAYTAEQELLRLANSHSNVPTQINGFNLDSSNKISQILEICTSLVTHFTTLTTKIDKIINRIYTTNEENGSEEIKEEKEVPDHNDNNENEEREECSGNAVTEETPRRKKPKKKKNKRRLTQEGKDEIQANQTLHIVKDNREEKQTNSSDEDEANKEDSEKSEETKVKTPSEKKETNIDQGNTSNHDHHLQDNSENHADHYNDYENDMDYTAVHGSLVEEISHLNQQINTVQQNIRKIEAAKLNQNSFEDANLISEFQAVLIEAKDTIKGLEKLRELREQELKAIEAL